MNELLIGIALSFSYIFIHFSLNKWGFIRWYEDILNSKYLPEWCDLCFAFWYSTTLILVSTYFNEHLPYSIIYDGLGYFVRVIIIAMSVSAFVNLQLFYRNGN